MKYINIDQIKIIKQYFSKHQMIHKRYINSFMNHYQFIYKKLQLQLKDFPQWKNIDNIIFGILHNKQLNKCKICNKIIPFNRYSKLIAEYCSNKCRNSDIQIKQKMKNSRINTCLKKYNVINVFQNKNIKEKIKNTIKQKYNCQNVFQSQEIKNKIKQTILIKYNVDSYSKTKQFLIKINIRSLQKFDTLFPSQNQQIKQKIKNNNLKKYGVQCTLSYEDFKNKKIKTNLQKYGYQVAAKSDIVKNKIRQITLNKVYISLIEKIKDIVIPCFSINEFTGRGYYKKYQWICKKCNNKFKDHIYSHIPRCPICYPIKLNYSKKEKQLAKFCKQHFLYIKENNRQIIKPYQLDIVIPQIKLAIQFNGCYFHNMNNIPFNYHLNKTQMCQEKGYRLIHIWQDQWDNNSQQIKQKLINIFQNKEVIDTSKLLDRCWYSTLQFQNYQIIQPQIVLKNNYYIENCGYLKIF